MTRPVVVALTSDERARARREFDLQQKIKAEAIAEAKAKAEAERIAREEAEIKKLRKTMVFKARPAPGSTSVQPKVIDH